MTNGTGQFPEKSGLGPKLEPRPGERDFFQRVEQTPQLEAIKAEQQPERGQERVKEFLRGLQQEIESLPEIKHEADLHHASVANISGVLAQALQLAIDQNVSEGLKFLQRLGASTYLLDAYHDLAAGHFYRALVEHQRITSV